MKIRSKLVLFLIMLALSTSCIMQSERDYLAESGTVKVLYWDKTSFFERYGNLLSLKFPEIEFDIVPLKQVYASQVSPFEALNQLVESEKPDLLHLNYYNYLRLANSNALQSLDNISDRSYEHVLQPILRMLKKTHTNELYGIAPSFNSNVIYLNLDLFHKHGVSVPETRLSWDEFIILAQRFSPDFGLSFDQSDPYNLAVSIGFLQGLRLTDSNRRLQINAKSWIDVFEKVKLLVNGDFVTFQSHSTDHFWGNTFLSGKSAMTIDTDNLNNLLMQQKEEKKIAFDWATIELPYTHQYPAGTSAIILEDIFAVHKESENKDHALKVIDYLLSEEMGKIIYQSTRALPSRASEKFISDNELGAFYANGELANDLQLEYDNYSESFLQLLYEKGQGMTQIILNNDISAEEALNTLQNELSGYVE